LVRPVKRTSGLASPSFHRALRPIQLSPLPIKLSFSAKAENLRQDGAREEYRVPFAVTRARYRPIAPFGPRFSAFAENDRNIYTEQTDRASFTIWPLPSSSRRHPQTVPIIKLSSSRWWRISSRNGPWSVLSNGHPASRLRRSTERSAQSSSLPFPSICHSLRRQRTSGRMERGEDIGRLFAVTRARYRPIAPSARGSLPSQRMTELYRWNKRI